MQIWRIIYGVAVENLKERYSSTEIKEQFSEQRVQGVGEFFTSSVMASPSGKPADLAIWAEWEDDDENWGRCMKGILLGVHDGLEEYLMLEELSQEMDNIFASNVHPVGRIRWLKEEYKEPISDVKEIINNALQQQLRS
jgi:hypothetical protein